MQKFELERSRLFPYIAWGTVIGFSVFVLSIIQNVKETTTTLAETTQSLEQKIKNSNGGY